MESLKSQQDKTLWRSFAQQEGLSEQQLEQCIQYYTLLEAWNKKMNLTSITGLESVIPYHFQDSLRIGQFVDFSTVSALADVGTGAGFPGLPLKIKYPHLFCLLIEVNQKKIQFLRAVIDALGLTNIEIYEQDWRTFLRTTDYPIDIFAARASLAMDDLTRIFKSTSPYSNAQLIYWATKTWEPEQEKQFFQKNERYTVGGKQRKYAFFAAPTKK